MEGLKGIIALDIDGTITVDKHHLEKEIKNYFNSLIKEGWKFIFITGRTFTFGKPILSDIEGEFHFAVQNGAALIKMPSERLMIKHYLPVSLLPQLDAIFVSEPGGLIVESGKETGDVCYYRDESFTREELEYIRFRIQISSQKWISVKSFDELNLTDFAVGKYFASQKKAHEIAEKVRKLAPLNVIVIRDPFNPGNYLAHVNDRFASKGHILEEFQGMQKNPLPIIGAGDDFNDLEMLEKCSFKIVMQNAPEQMHTLADLVAPPAQDLGIIKALKEAIRSYGRNNKN